MPDEPMYPAEMEKLLRRARIRNFKATFEVETGIGGPDAETVTFEVILPVGELRQEIGWEVVNGFVDQEFLAFPAGEARHVIRMSLFVDRTFDRSKQATIRVVDE